MSNVWREEPRWEHWLVFLCVAVLIWFATRNRWSGVRKWFAEHSQPIFLETRSITRVDGSFYLYDTPVLAGGSVPAVTRVGNKMMTSTDVEVLRAQPGLDDEQRAALNTATIYMPLADRVLIERTHRDRTADWATERQQILARIDAQHPIETAPTTRLPVMVVTTPVKTPMADTIVTAEIVAETAFVEPTKVPKHAKGMFNDGADENWGAVLAATPEGQIEVPGFTTHPGPDTLTAEEIDDARWGAEMFAAFSRIDDARDTCNAALIEINPAWETMFAEIDAHLENDARNHAANLAAAADDIESSLSLVHA